VLEPVFPVERLGVVAGGAPHGQILPVRMVLVPLDDFPLTSLRRV
jgi:hypothetical protein